jgi:hypothetical protein
VSLLILSPLEKAYCRFQELQADRLALEITNESEAFVSAYRKLASRSMSAAEPPRLAHWLFDDAPSLAQRLAVAEEYEQEKQRLAGNVAPSARGGRGAPSVEVLVDHAAAEYGPSNAGTKKPPDPARMRAS